MYSTHPSSIRVIINDLGYLTPKHSCGPNINTLSLFLNYLLLERPEKGNDALFIFNMRF